MRKPKTEGIKKKARNDLSYRPKGAAKKKVKKETIRKSRVPKTRNAGTQTESSFWTMLRSHLRKLSLRWKPIQKAREAARRPYTGPNKRQKWEYNCACCNGWFSDKEVSVDHRIPCGSLKCSDDLKGFIERLFVEDGLDVLCNKCHDIKSISDRENIRNEKKD